MKDFSKSRHTADSLLQKMIQMNKGKTAADVGIDPSWLSAYGVIARRCNDEKTLSVNPYPYERGPNVTPTRGGFFELSAWAVRRELEKQKSMHAVCEYESQYINAAGYWGAMGEAASELRDEALEGKMYDEAMRYDVWMLIFTRYTLRVVGMRTEFYVMAARDPTHARLVMPNLQRMNRSLAADDLQAPMDELDKQMHTQLMKAVSTLAASTATKRAGGGGNQGGSAAQQ